MSFDLVPGDIAIVAIGALECAIGILLILGRWLKVAVYLLLGQFVGVFAPLVLFTGRLFDGPHNAPGRNVGLSGSGSMPPGHSIVPKSWSTATASKTSRSSRLTRDPRMPIRK